jgi:hypothetical protein
MEFTGPLAGVDGRRLPPHRPLAAQSRMALQRRVEHGHTQVSQ